MASSISTEDVQFTPFTDGKIRVWFRMIDVGKDGHMCKDDFMAIADRFVKVSLQVVTGCLTALFGRVPRLLLVRSPSTLSS